MCSRSCTGLFIVLAQPFSIIPAKRCKQRIERVDNLQPQRIADPADAASRVPRCPPCPTELPAVTRVAFIYPAPLFPVSACRHNKLGADGVTALSSGLTALTNLRSLVVR